MKDRDYLTTVGFAGPFWQLREWCGFEPLCMAFLDDPEFVREMIAFWIEFVSATMRRALDSGTVDQIHISEDMAYKEKCMISPALVREFIMPAWSRWAREARQADVPLIAVDSDGKVDELIPLWIESGVNVCDPMEVAAGNDLPAYRRQFGRQIAFRGGVDKRCIARGGDVIVKELARLEPVVRDGGYIPGCDHGVPSDISWPNMVRYCRLLAEMTGWL
jgi:uroporphyrinogen decarboxylase